MLAPELSIQGKIFTDSISKADRSGPHERTPSDWENEFLAQQTAAFSDETANPINDDTTGKCTDDGPGTYHSPKCYSRSLLLFPFHDLCPLDQP